MSNWDRFTETFFNGKVMLRYLPDILSGVVVTVELAFLIVVTGIAAGLALALLRSLAVRPLNWRSSSSSICSARCPRWSSSC